MLYKGLILSLFFLVSCSDKYQSKKEFSLLDKTVNSEHRSEKNKVRDVYRNPVETLTFFEVKSDMKVAEIAPGGGWYTEILGPYLKKNGELYLTRFSESSKRSYAPRLNEKLKNAVLDKNYYGKTYFSVLETPDAIEEIAPQNTLDRVLTFRNVHNWMKDGKAEVVFKEFYKALKPGGILGVVEHRAKMNQPQDPKAKSGYVREDYVIKLAQAAGFEFVAKSEINANYNDSSDHPEGVWTLPPSLRLKDKDRAYYQAIGESDRMTLKFVKLSPAKN